MKTDRWRDYCCSPVSVQQVFTQVLKQQMQKTLHSLLPMPLRLPPEFSQKNSVTAAPVLVCREHLSNGRAQAVIVNSGNANACTGVVGMANARRMAAVAAEQLGIDADLVLVSSTGVIGQQLPMDKIENGIQTAASALSTEGGSDAAEAIMTTDTHPKSVAVEVEIDGVPVRIGGIAKGSGMIAPIWRPCSPI